MLTLVIVPGTSVRSPPPLHHGGAQHEAGQHRTRERESGSSVLECAMCLVSYDSGRAHASGERLVRQRSGELGRAGKPVGGELLERGQHRRFHMRGNRPPPGEQRSRLLGDHLRHDRLRRGTRERRLADQHFIEHGTEGVDVRPGGDLALAHGLLRAHVMRRSQGQPCLGHASPAGGAHRQGDPEVRHQRRAVVQQDVLGLDVAVDHTVSMRVVEGAGRPPSRSARHQRPEAASPERAGRGAIRPRRRASRSRGTTAGGPGLRPSRGAAGYAGCWRLAVVRISARNRSAPINAASSGRSTLSATLRWCLRSSAR